MKRLFACAVAAALALPLVARAQAWPAAKPVRLVIPFPAGGATDIIGRTVAQKLSAALGQQVVVDNKPGAGGAIGSDMVAKATPDGYTLLLATSSTHSIGPALNAKMPYDAVKDFAPVAHVANAPSVLVVGKDFPAATAKELIDARWQTKPLVRNSAYSVATGKDSEDIVPVMVFDDGTQTYFSFPNNRPIPTVFQIAPDGSEEMVNARMDPDDLLVADRVGRRFVLRLGESVAAIINDAFDLDGVPPKDGTTVPGVARVVKAATTSQLANQPANRPAP